MNNRNIEIKIKNRPLFYYMLVMVIFLLTLKILIMLNGRVYVWYLDGASQHLSALTYYSAYLREILSGIFQGDFTFPKWDLAIGEGSDILAVFHYYCIGDPLALLSVFFSSDKMYICYELIIYIRMILSGLSFMYFVKSFDGGSLAAKASDSAVTAGAVLYTFSGWIVYMSTRHPFFVMPMILLPLLLCGVEFIIAGKKRGFMAVVVFICALTNLYFFYIMVVLTVIYVAVRLVVLYKKDIKNILTRLAVIALESVTGLLMGCIILYPVAKVFLSDSRVGGGNLGIFYPLTYYLSLPQSLVSGYWSYYLFIGVGLPGLAAIYLAFARKGNVLLKAFLAISGIILLFPIFGSILNGFAYPSNRWAFAIPLVCSVGLVVLWEEFSAFSVKDLIILSIISAVCLAGSIYMESVSGIVMTVEGAALFLMLFFIKKGKAAGYILPAGVIISQLTLMILYNSSWMEQFASSPWLDIYYNYNEAQHIASLEEDSTVRYSGDILTENVSPIAQVSSTQFYWSNANPYVGRFRSDIGSPEYRLYYYSGYNAAAIPLNLAGCTYYAQSDIRRNPLPYGYTPGEHIDVGYTIYRDDINTSLVYTYDSSVSESYWNELNPVDRQILITDKLVVPDEYADQASCELESGKVGCDISKDESGKTTISFEGRENSETYLIFDGLNCDSVDEFLTLWAGISGTDEDYALQYYTLSNWFNDRHLFVLNMGWHGEAVNEIVLQAEANTPYTCDLSVACIDMDMARENLQKRFEDSPEVIRTEDRGTVIGFDTGSEDEKYYVVATPYSEHWKAYIDGAEAEVIQANIQYMAVKVPAGHHSVEFRYEGDYTAGLILSAAGVLVFAGYMICGKIRKDKKIRS
ncbi:MAG: YfhO family protein [Saccharofermentans sp.]|nr:YfhO family protein [Saccharofermentans sp.]